MGKWKVKKPDGKVYGPVDTLTLVRWIEERRVIKGDLISPAEEEKWVEVEKIPEFSSYFEIPPQKPPVKPEREEITCPSCGKIWPKGTVICTDCGTNLKTGKKLKGVEASEEVLEEGELLSLRALREAFSALKRNPFSLAGTTLLFFLINLFVSYLSRLGSTLSLLSLILLPPLSLGFLHFCLKRVKGEDRGVRELFYPFTFFFSAWGIVVLVRSLIGFASLFFLVPGIIVGLSLFFSYFLVSEERKGVFEAIKESFRLSEGLRWKILATWVLGSLLNIAGMLALGVGILFTLPIAPMGVAYIYDQAVKGNLESAKEFTSKKEIALALLPVILIGAILVILILVSFPILIKTMMKFKAG